MMSLVEERLEALGKDLEAWDGPGTAPPERLGDRFRELVARLMANLENINPEEQAALIAAASAMIAAFVYPAAEFYLPVEQGRIQLSAIMTAHGFP